MAQFRASEQHQHTAAEQQQDQELVASRQPVDHDLLQDSSDLLDEIDSVLEENAEDYVRGFVQKGGQ